VLAKRTEPGRHTSRPKEGGPGRTVRQACQIPKKNDSGTKASEFF